MAGVGIDRVVGLGVGSSRVTTNLTAKVGANGAQPKTISRISHHERDKFDHKLL